MKHKHHLRRLNDDTKAGIATYVLIMFGMAFILFLFGFQTMFTAYTGNANIQNDSGTNISITNRDLNQGNTLIQLIMSPISILSISAGALIGGFIIFRFLGSTNVYFQYVIPAVILMALNIFVFPVGSLYDETSNLTIYGISIISIFLIALFNIFYILAAVDFIRGPTG